MGSTSENKNRFSRTAVRGSTKIITRIIRCKDCGFRSDRAFNVNRHYERIHKPAKKQINCCGKKYVTKGQYYQHCANVHPKSRRSSIVSSTKYEIKTTTTVIKKECESVRRSLRNMVKQKKEIKQEVCFDEDTPLINYVNDLKLIKKEEEEREENDIKLEEKCEKFDIDNCIEIYFKGDTTSELHAKIQKEFLRNIDFDIFKII